MRALAFATTTIVWSFANTNLAVTCLEIRTGSVPVSGCCCSAAATQQIARLLTTRMCVCACVPIGTCAMLNSHTCRAFINIVIYSYTKRPHALSLHPLAIKSFYCTSATFFICLFFRFHIFYVRFYFFPPAHLSYGTFRKFNAQFTAIGYQVSWSWQQQQQLWQQ